MRRASLLAASVLALGCAHGGEPDLATLASSSDQIVWEAGQKAFDRRQWETARQYFRRIIDGFPNSELGPSARLALADSYFKEGGTANYILAVSAYREFLTFYPSHPRSDYAQHQVGECFFKQRNGPDRDQTPTRNALEEYQKLLDLYLSSGYAIAARARITECRQSLARAEYLAGYFYQRTRQACRAAISRYEGILSDYPDYQHLDEVLLRLAQCLVQSGRAAEAQPHLARLLEQYPRSEHAESARRLMGDLTKSAPDSLPPPSPAPSSPPAAPPSRGAP